MALDDLIGDGERAVAAAGRRQIDDDRAVTHALDDILRHQHGRAAAGDERRGDDDMRLGQLVGERGLLARLGLVGEFLGIAALPRAALAEIEIDRLGAEREDLLARLGAHVIGVDIRAQATRGGDRLESGHARAQHHHPRRLGRTGRGHHHRQEAPIARGGLDHGAIAGDVALRGQHVHRLGARGAGHPLQRQDAHPLRQQAREDRILAAGFEQTDVESARTHGLDVGFVRTADPEQQVDVIGAGTVAQAGAGRLVVGVRIAGTHPGAGLDHDLEALTDELLHDIRGRRYARLTRACLQRDSNLHQSIRPCCGAPPPGRQNSRIIPSALVDRNLLIYRSLRGVSLTVAMPVDGMASAGRSTRH